MMGQHTWDNPPLKKIERDWILVCYDIPASENAFRKYVLRSLRKLGALQFTESVYYMPYTSQGLNAANQIGQTGSVYVFYSKLPELEQAQTLTRQYFLELVSRVENLERKVWVVEEKFSTRDRAKTVSALKRLRGEYRGLVKAADLIQFDPLTERLAHVRRRLEKIRDSMKKSRREEDRGG